MEILDAFSLKNEPMFAPQPDRGLVAPFGLGLVAADADADVGLGDREEPFGGVPDAAGAREKLLGVNENGRRKLAWVAVFGASSPTSVI
jgi:hypothetical protein